MRSSLSDVALVGDLVRQPTISAALADVMFIGDKRRARGTSLCADVILVVIVSAFTDMIFIYLGDLITEPGFTEAAITDVMQVGSLFHRPDSLFLRHGFSSVIQ
ncbi:hypothetical protein SLEP1_g51295 [Rubroshorea leprosula]|uniref:Uncharacterized protein n=1 Tax=Rubroshorea leprosula TaxID=152421 RepID=A0AAV5M477_9ROSI|nr:hypothetical protein SLEP1_g51295 [Rubroshorea leprosula]